MGLSVYLPEQAEQWDTIVRSFQNYDVYWLSGYAKAFQVHGDGEPMLFFYDDGTTRGIHVVMKRDIARDSCFRDKLKEGCWFDFATPYGYGGWIIEGDNSEDLFRTYLDWLESNGIISEFIRFHPLVKNHEACRDFYEVVSLGKVVHMDLSTPEMIWNNLTSENRNRNRKAEKNGIRVYNGHFPGIYEQFRVIYNKTMDRDHAEPYYYFEPEFYQAILDELPQNSQVFWAEKDKQIIAASIMIYANGRMSYHLSGSLEEYNRFAPGNLIMVTAARWGCTNGYKTLLLGGGVGSREDNLLRFKKTFYKGTADYFYTGRKVIDRDKYDFLMKLRNLPENTFFPQYRAQA